MLPNQKTCYRCRQPLTEGSNFCVACGFHNEGATIDKTLQVHQQLENRRQWWEAFGRLTDLLRFIRFR
jgi:hypothetical protein